MAFKTKLLPLATILAGLSTTADAASLAGINAFFCGGQGNGLTTASTRSGWAPETYRGRASLATPRDTASTVKLRIIYDMGDRVEIDHCGGTVIDKNWIVTAGHCVAADRSWDRIEVIAGDEHLDGGKRIKRTTRQAVCHAGFRYETLENDIALIHVKDPLPARITPAQLDFERTPSLRRGDYGIGHGWPVTGGRAGDRYLNKTPLHVREVNLRSYITVTSATGRPADGLCRGESGGPLLSNGRYGRRLSGVLSGIQPGTENGYGQECMLTGYEMYFTPIASFRSWIDSVQSVCTVNPTSCGGTVKPRTYASVGYAAYHGGTKPASYEPASPVYEPIQTVQTRPLYQTATVAAPQPTYINIGPAPTYGYTPSAPTYVANSQPYIQLGQPVYIDTGTYGSGAMAPIYDDPGYGGGHATFIAPAHQPVTVAYGAPAVIYGSAFRHHAR